MVNLKPVLSCVISLFLVLTDVGAEEDAYVVKKLNEDFSCVPLDSGGLCVGDIKVLKETATSYEQSIKLVNSSLDTFANKSCADAVIKSTCLGFPRCELKKQYIDVETAVAQCEKAKSVCPETVINTFFNCTEKRERYEEMNKQWRRLKVECKVFDGNTGICPDINYKFVDTPGVNYTDSFIQAKNLLEGIMNNVTSDCYKTVKKAVCQLVGVVCSDDGEYAVSLLSKQQCTKATKCIPDGISLIKLACSSLPDENIAKNVSYPGRSPSTGVPTQPDTGSPKQNDTGAPTQPDSASFLAPTLEVVLPIIIFLAGLLVRA